VCGNDLFLLETLNWVASRCIRVEHVSVSGKNDMISVEYLQMFGKNIMSIKLSENCLQFSASSALIAHYCVYLRSVEYSADYVSDSFLELLNACPRIESLKVSSLRDNQWHSNVKPKINTLRVHSLDVYCDNFATGYILSM